MQRSNYVEYSFDRCPRDSRAQRKSSVRARGLEISNKLLCCNVASNNVVTPTCSLKLLLINVTVFKSLLAIHSKPSLRSTDSSIQKMERKPPTGSLISCYVFRRQKHRSLHQTHSWDLYSLSAKVGTCATPRCPFEKEKGHEASQFHGGD